MSKAVDGLLKGHGALTSEAYQRARVMRGPQGALVNVSAAQTEASFSRAQHEPFVSTREPMSVDSVTHSHVISDLKKIRKGKLLSPILLIRGDAHKGAPLVIADGFHRVCASWYWSEDAPVSCCLVDSPVA
jgi:hypothetical protein